MVVPQQTPLLAASPPKDSAPPSSASPVQTKVSYNDIAQGSSRKMKRKGETFLLDSGEICVSIPNSVIAKNEHRWEEFIIAQFHAKPPSPGALHAIANSIWSSKLRNITVSKLSKKSFLIKIPCPSTRQRVLAQGMWHIDNQSMFVAKWKLGLQPAIPELSSVPVWLDFHNVPPQFYSEEGLEHIAGTLGNPLFLHPATANMSNLEVARVFTIIDPTKPLPEAINVKFDSGHIERVEVSSPWLLPTCDHCKEIGHSIKSCLTALITCSLCQSTAHKLEECPKAKKTEVPKEGEKKKKKKKRKAKAPVLPQQVGTEVTEVSEGNIVIDIGLDKINSASESDHQSSKEKEVQPSVSDSLIFSDSEQEEPSSAEKESSSSGEDSSDSSSSDDDTGFEEAVSKKTKKHQRKQAKKQLWSSGFREKKSLTGAKAPSPDISNDRHFQLECSRL